MDRVMLQLYRHNHLKGFMQATNNTKPQCSSHIIIMLTYVKTVTYFPPFGAIFSKSSTPPFFAHTPLTFLHYGGIDRNLAVTDRKKWWALWFYGQINLPT